MTKLSSERLSKADLKFFLNILNKAEEEAQTEIEIDGDNKSEATAALKRITRIRLAVIDLDNPLANGCESRYFGIIKLSCYYIKDIRNKTKSFLKDRRTIQTKQGSHRNHVGSEYEEPQGYYAQDKTRKIERASWRRRDSVSGQDWIWSYTTNIFIPIC